MEISASSTIIPILLPPLKLPHRRGIINFTNSFSCVMFSFEQYSIITARAHAAECSLNKRLSALIKADV